MFLNKKNTGLLGIDISVSSIKLLGLSEVNKQWVVDYYLREEIPSEMISDSKISDIEAVGNLLKDMMQLIKFDKRPVAISVSSSSVITKVIQMNAEMSDYEIEMQLQVDAEQYIPFPLDELSLDFQVMGPSSVDNSLIDVFLVACRNEEIESKQSILNIAGVTPSIIDVDVFALHRTLPLMENSLDFSIEDKVIVMVDIGKTVTNICVSQNNQILFMRERVFGSHQLIEEIRSSYGLSQDEAMVAQIHGGLPDDYENTVLKTFKEAALHEIKHSLQLFYSSVEITSIDCIILSGGVSKIEGLVDTISARMSVPTFIGDIFSEMKISSKIDDEQFEADASSFMISAGLAMRDE